MALRCFRCSDVVETGAPLSWTGLEKHSELNTRGFGVVSNGKGLNSC